MCKYCTRFYVDSKSIMFLLKQTTMFLSFNTSGEDINNIFKDVKKTIIYANIFYKACDFVEHGPEHINFGETFRELVDKPFALYVLYFEVLFRIYFNQLKLV